ncbi:MAG: GlsB/YeaQ/YmgE family stress response membrane protein [Candidatus Eisenbacteria bacterium]
MSILWTILIGFLVGLLAKFLLPGRDPGGLIVTTLIGIGGALAASFLGRSMGWYADGQPAGFLASVVGAIALLMIYRLVRRSPNTASPRLR